MASEPLAVYVQYPRELEELLAENQVSLADLLRRQHVDVVERDAVLPVSPAGSASREPVTLLVFVGITAVSALAPIISRVVGQLTGKQLTIVEKTTEPVLDGAGKPVLDSAGQPLQKITEKSSPLPLQTDVKFLGLSFTTSEKS